MIKEILQLISSGMIGAAIMGWAGLSSYEKGYDDGYKDGRNSLGALWISRKNGKTEILYRDSEEDEDEQDNPNDT